MEFPSRKSARLQQFDYASPNYYFVTICTKHHANVFVTESSQQETGFSYTELGRAAECNLLEIPNHYPSIRIDKYVIMPNHVHMIVILQPQHNGPSLSAVIGSYKSSVSKFHGQPVWQRSFHDHVIRNEDDYRRIWQYIDNNPLKWELDCFYSPF